MMRCSLCWPPFGLGDFSRQACAALLRVRRCTFGVFPIYQDALELGAVLGVAVQAREFLLDVEAPDSAHRGPVLLLFSCVVKLYKFCDD